MELSAFIDYLKAEGLEGDQFVIELDGEDDEACFSGESYLYYECVVFTGEDDIYSAYQTPHISEGDLTILFKDKRVEINFRKIRTFLSAGYEKLYVHSDLAEAPSYVIEIVEEDIGRAMLVEYGLKRGQKYYCHIHYDHHFINSKDGPWQRTNAILWISDREFIDGEPQVRLTPGYQGWTY